MRARVLFIGGWGRSGSTLLDRVLGHVPGVVSLGEVREIWVRGVIEDRPCGCDRPFSECPFWTEVGDRAWGGWRSFDVDDQGIAWPVETMDPFGNKAVEVWGASLATATETPHKLTSVTDPGGGGGFQKRWGHRIKANL